MRKRRMLRSPVALAALVAIGVMLAGCSDDKKNFGLANSPPVVTILAAGVCPGSVDTICLTVLLSDANQADTDGGLTVQVELANGGNTWQNLLVDVIDVDLLGFVPAWMGNEATDVPFTRDQNAPATVEIQISSSDTAVLPSIPDMTGTITVIDAWGAETTVDFGPFSTEALATEPTCSVTAPTALSSGNVTVNFQVDDAQGDAAEAVLEYSLNGGAFMPATVVGGVATSGCNPAAPNANGVTGITPGAATSLQWDSAADGVGLNTVTDVSLRLWVQDCTSVGRGGLFNSPCVSGIFQVLNNGTPTCNVTGPAAGTTLAGTMPIDVDYSVTDDDASVSATLEYSINGGATWSMCSGTNPQAGGTGARTFSWDVVADLTGQLPADAQVRVTLDDGTGRPTLSTCVSGTFTIVPISEPDCAWTSPGAGCIDAFGGGGTVDLVFDLNDAQGDPINYTICFDGGGAPTITGVTNGTIAPFTATHTGACGTGVQVSGAASGATTATWDFLADGYGAMTCDAVTFTIYPEDGTAGTGFSSCAGSFSVSNNGAPSCSVNSISGSNVDFDLVDADSATVGALFEYSINGGTSWSICSDSDMGGNPRDYAPGAGLSFPWAGTTDIPMCTTGVLVRVTVDDGVALPNRPATCTSAPTDINCIPVAAQCRVVDVLDTAATGPTGVIPNHMLGAGGPTADIGGENPATKSGLYWDFDYVGLNEGAFNTTVQLTAADGSNVGNPVVLMSAGQDYTGFDVDPVGPCNMVDTFQLVLEADVGGVSTDFSAAMTSFGSTTVDCTWSTSDPTAVDVSADGLLTAVGENSCATISWSLVSNDPTQITIDPTCTGGDIVACVDSGGVDFATRTIWLPIGDVDLNIPGMPSGPAVPGNPGDMFGCTFIVNTDTYGVAAYSLSTSYQIATIVEWYIAPPPPFPPTYDIDSIGGSSGALGVPFAINPGSGGSGTPGQTTWNDVDAYGIAMGIFDIATQNFVVVASGTSFINLQVQELSDTQPCNIWVTNPCMPYSTTGCPGTPPAGGYPSISGSGFITVP